MRRFSTSVTITDPLVKYQSLVATGTYQPDPAQLRLALHLRKIYNRVKDYSPRIEYRQRLAQVAKLTEKSKEPESDPDAIALRGHSIWRNPLFKHLHTSPEGRETLALTRMLASHETAITIDSPKGLFLSGEVGTGKSMLLDLLAEGLPTERKRRWHCNTFMLYILSQLDRHRKGAATVPEGSGYSLLWMAKKLIEDSPILFLDEFQLPDRAASKILSHLFMAFFQLGGVLVASSNRMPEELQKATGADYAPAPSRGLVRRLFGTASRQAGDLYGSSSDFANFLEVLKARCDFWQMDAARDWRRREEVESMDHSDTPSLLAQGLSMSENEKKTRPANYFMANDSLDAWLEKVKSVTNGGHIPWQPATIVVYGRRLTIPQHHNGVVLWTFDRLVESFGPADYITMASSYHTFIIDNVPVLTILQKNEARRFITLLDALYEAKCKLILRAATTPDNLFFPETQASTQVTLADDDATYSETISDVFQDQVSPFRPNVSYYDKPSTSKYDPDQDSDFGLEKTVDFGNASAFTGEDERFAYKRAISRLWELCGAQWHARTGEWWQPLPAEARHWEGGRASVPATEILQSPSTGDGEGMGGSVQAEEFGLSKWRIQQLKADSAS